MLLLLPDAAWAWGPGVHMVTGNWLLQNSQLLPAALAAAITRFPSLYLRGCLSPDIFIGKGCAAKEGHSHNWSTGLTLLARAHTRQKQAYAAGYLSHLAADTVAHNVYVPGAFETAPGRNMYGKLAHVYLEIQADNAVPWNRKEALSVLRGSGSRGADRMLMRATQQKAWLFGVKKRLFSQSIGIGGLKSWRASMLTLDSALHGNRPLVELAALLAVSARAMVDVLRNPYGSPVCAVDPVGTEALARASRMEQAVQSAHLPQPVAPDEDDDTADDMHARACMECPALAALSGSIYTLPVPLLHLPQLDDSELSVLPGGGLVDVFGNVLHGGPFVPEAQKVD